MTTLDKFCWLDNNSLCYGLGGFFWGRQCQYQMLQTILFINDGLPDHQGFFSVRNIANGIADLNNGVFRLGQLLNV